MDTKERALAAIEDAFSETLILRFHRLADNAVDQGLDQAVAEFTRGLASLGQAHSRAIIAVQKVIW